MCIHSPQALRTLSPSSCERAEGRGDGEEGGPVRRPRTTEHVPLLDIGPFHDISYTQSGEIVRVHYSLSGVKQPRLQFRPQEGIIAGMVKRELAVRHARGANVTLARGDS